MQETKQQYSPGTCLWVSLEKTIKRSFVKCRYLVSTCLAMRRNISIRQFFSVIVFFISTARLKLSESDSTRALILITMILKQYQMKPVMCFDAVNIPEKSKHARNCFNEIERNTFFYDT